MSKLALSIAKTNIVTDHPSYTIKNDRMWVVGAGVALSMPQVKIIGMKEDDLELPYFAEPIEYGGIPLDKSFIEALTWVSKASAKNDVRYYLNSVMFDPKGRLVATDGHRCHVVQCEAMKQLDCQIIVPSEAVKRLLTLVKEQKVPYLSLFVSGDRAASKFVVGGAELYFSESDGYYPDIDRIIPYDDKLMKFDVDLPALGKQYKSEAKLTDPAGKALILYNGTISLRSEDVIGKYGIELPKAVGFNCNYLTDVLVKECESYITDDSDKLVVKAPNKVAVIMGIRV